jgi:hypothetical protein
MIVDCCPILQVQKVTFRPTRIVAVVIGPGVVPHIAQTTRIGQIDQSPTL